jgi:hypothetical protein
LAPSQRVRSRCDESERGSERKKADDELGVNAVPQSLRGRDGGCKTRVFFLGYETGIEEVLRNAAEPDGAEAFGDDQEWRSDERTGVKGDIRPEGLEVASPM